MEEERSDFHVTQMLFKRIASWKLELNDIFMVLHLRSTECHFPYGITQCYWPPDTNEHTLP